MVYEAVHCDILRKMTDQPTFGGKMYRASLAVPVMFVLFAVAGCGGSKGLSRQELIAKADPICKRANSVFESQSLTMQNYTRVATLEARAYRQASDELAKLAPPESMASDWKVIIDGYRRASVGLEDISKAPLLPGRNKFSKGIIKGEEELAKGQHVRDVTALRSGFIDCSKL